ncbi:hypothetical protein LX36DRAFT_427412 [Colletotrichum falcatum]|nr:hypothetical protein LX36DRAFT_427412 [Colletotrichum falcatum]
METYNSFDCTNPSVAVLTRNPSARRLLSLSFIPREETVTISPLQTSPLAFHEPPPPEISPPAPSLHISPTIVDETSLVGSVVKRLTSNEKIGGSIPPRGNNLGQPGCLPCLLLFLEALYSHSISL